MESLDPLLVALDQEPEGACLVHLQQCHWAGPELAGARCEHDESTVVESVTQLGTFTVMFIVESIIVPVSGKSLGGGELLMASVPPSADAPQTGLPWAHDD